MSTKTEKMGEQMGFFCRAMGAMTIRQEGAVVRGCTGSMYFTLTLVEMVNRVTVDIEWESKGMLPSDLASYARVIGALTQVVQNIEHVCVALDLGKLSESDSQKGWSQKG